VSWSLQGRRHIIEGSTAKDADIVELNVNYRFRSISDG
jgi:hypothetical protein